MSSNQKHTTDPNRDLLDLVHAMSLAADREGVLAILLEAAARLVPSDGTSVMWLDEDHLKVVGSRGPVAALPGLILPASQMGAARSTLNGSRAILVADTADDARWQRVPGEERALSWLGAPLLVEGRAAGLLVWTARERNQFSQSDLETATTIAAHVAPILHRVQLLDDMRHRLKDLVERRPPPGAESVDLADELFPVVTEACEYTQARHAFLFLAEEATGQMHCVVAAGEARERLARVILRGDGTLGGWAMPGARSPGWFGNNRSDRQVVSELGIRNALILPVQVKGTPVGMLGVAERSDGAAFGPDSARIMAQLASEASVIVERTHQSRPEPERYDYEMMVQSAPLGVAVLTLTGDIRFCNPGLAESLSRTSRNLEGRNLSEFLVPGDRRRLSHMLEEVAATRQRRQLDVHLRSALGEQRFVRISLAVARISEDVADNLIAIMEDITSLKILEQERVEHLRELREKNSLLKELDQLKSRFVSNVSHELRTPLAVIKLYATLARKGRPEKKEHYLQTIEQETHRLETMVENILDLTRMDRQTLQVHPEMLAAEEIVAHVLEVYGETAKRKGIELRNDILAPLPCLWADKNHLVQMLTNLVDNALKYTPRGGQVWIAAGTAQLESGPFLEISVGDTGTGIPEEEHSKVFERFYRGTNNAPGTTGTGLGLAIVQELMAQHGGRVTLHSRFGEGSTFVLQFPLGESQAAARDLNQN